MKRIPSKKSVAGKNKTKLSGTTKKSPKPDHSWLKMAETEGDQQKAKDKIWWLKATQKGVYICVLFVLILLLLLQVAACIETYIKGPTYIETKVVQQNKALFPAMTICPVSNGYKADVLKVCWYAKLRILKKIVWIISLSVQNLKLVLYFFK